jgi:hydrogenase maturation protein HypF
MFIWKLTFKTRFQRIQPLIKRWNWLRVKIRVTGIVQGVGFRPFIYRIATKNKLTGYVRNRGDAGVEILVEGTEKNVKRFIEQLQMKKPPLAQIHQVLVESLSGEQAYSNFSILKSSKETELSGSVVPPDVAICNECLTELRNPRNPRHAYFFITCVNCGPRFTIIERLPYDRQNTTMRQFSMCNFCQKEYTDPANRRFHAQTVACPKCGPEAYLTTNKGERINCEDPVREAGKLIAEGNILAIKGYGGFHIATSTLLPEPIAKLRKVKYRSQKPFAIMARSIEAVRRFAKVSPEEEKWLLSHIRPILLVRKKEKFPLSDLIAPGLHTVGVMLPYTGMHYMLFDKVNELAFVMTSANPPNQPIINNDKTALKKLGNFVDYFLFHNREIAQRCDDSVVRLHGKNPSIIRRSRGYAPAPIRLKTHVSKTALGLGGELNVTGCIMLGNKAFLTQHIGDVENLETLQFLKEAVYHLARLINAEIEAISCDLHPKFSTTRLAENLGAQLNVPVLKVQHHYAHAAALMAEHDLDELICVACDGYGYGEDGGAWGGEIIYAQQSGAWSFKRLAHLEQHALLGGDLATRYPLRMAAAILAKETPPEKLWEWLKTQKEKFPYGEVEIQLLMQQIEKERKHPKILTSSCGRVLDAVAAILGICSERTYEGEPAMKLEAIATKGKEALSLKPEINGNSLITSNMVKEIFLNREKASVADLAFSAESYLARGLATLAIEKALELGVKNVGFTGGVAYNEHITLTIKRIVEEAGIQFFVHRLVPPGDGGISFGQAIIAGFAE